MPDRRTVLVIDDEAPIRRVIELKLRNAGYDVLLAADGAEGLHLIRTRRPDVVITDLTMPGLSGRELCEQSDRLKDERPFLTIVISGSDEAEREWAHALRDTRVTRKPFHPTALRDLVDQYFAEPHTADPAGP